MKNQIPKTIDDYIRLLTEVEEKFGNHEVYYVYEAADTSKLEEHYDIGGTVIYTPYTITSTSSEGKLRLLFVAS